MRGFAAAVVLNLSVAASEPHTNVSMCLGVPGWTVSFHDDFAGDELNASKWSVLQNETHGPTERELYACTRTHTRARAHLPLALPLPCLLTAWIASGSHVYASSCTHPSPLLILPAPGPSPITLFAGLLRIPLRRSYVDDADTVSVGDGVLTLTTRRRTAVSSSGKVYNFTSGWVESKSKAFQAYGRFEVRAKLPSPSSGRKGMWPDAWPAHWLMPEPTTSHPPNICWPVGGEIDIMEGYRPRGEDNAPLLDSVLFTYAVSSPPPP